eukprot:6717517-Alexandrium_andersonii.AAC.1
MSYARPTRCPGPCHILQRRQPLDSKRRFELSRPRCAGLPGPTGRSTGPGCWGRLAAQQG